MPCSTVRKVLHHEYPRYRTHLKALDPKSTILRFGFPCSHSTIDRLCDNFESSTANHVLFAIEDDQLDFVAMGHIAIHNGMEIALSVLKEHQSTGMGGAIMKRCIQWCRINGFLKGSMVCLSTNSAIKHLCSKYGMNLRSEHGETVATIDLEHATFNTYMSEAADSNIAAFDYLGKRLPSMWISNK